MSAIHALAEVSLGELDPSFSLASPPAFQALLSSPVVEAMWTVELSALLLIEGGANHIMAPPIVSHLAFGVPATGAPADGIAPAGLASALAFGGALLTGGAADVLEMVGGGDIQAVGGDTFVVRRGTGPRQIAPGGLANAVAFGIPNTGGGTQAIAPPGLAAGPVFGLPGLGSGFSVAALSDTILPEFPGFAGPFQIGGAFYGVALSPDKHDLVVVKATTASPVNGDWSNQDGTVAAGTAEIDCLWAFEDGAGDLHIFHQTSTGDVRYSVFDPGTDGFTLRNETVADAGSSNFDNAPTYPKVSGAVDSAGVVVCAAAYNNGTNERVRIFRKSGGAWANQGSGDEGTAATNYVDPVVLMGADSSDRITWFYNDYTNRDLLTNSISSSGTISGATELDPGVENSPYICTPSHLLGDTAYPAYMDGDFKISIRRFATGDPPGGATFLNDLTQDGILGEGNLLAPPYNVSCTVKTGASSLQTLYASRGQTDLRRNTDATVTGGGTDTEIIDLIDCFRLSANMGTTDILYFYSDGNAVPIFGTLAP